jgi:hypothetical protein
MVSADQLWLKELRAKAVALMPRNDKDTWDLGDGIDISSKQVPADQMTIDLPTTAHKIDARRPQALRTPK